MSKANLHPRAMWSTSRVEEAAEQGWRDVSVSKQEWKNVASVVLVVVRRGVIEAGHSSAAIGLRLKSLYAFPSGRC